MTSPYARAASTAERMVARAVLYTARNNETRFVSALRTLLPVARNEPWLRESYLNVGTLAGVRVLHEVGVSPSDIPSDELQYRRQSLREARCMSVVAEILAESGLEALPEASCFNDKRYSFSVWLAGADGESWLKTRLVWEERRSIETAAFWIRRGIRANRCWSTKQHGVAVKCSRCLLPIPVNAVRCATLSSVP